MSKGITEVFQASEDPCDVIIRHRGKDIKLTRLEELEYVRNKLNKFISKGLRKYAGYEDTNF